MRRFCLLCFAPLSWSVSWDFFCLFRKLPPICMECACRFEKKTAPFCSICHQDEKSSPCLDCEERIKENKAFLTTNRSLYKYNDFAAIYMTRYKFHRDYLLREVFSAELRKLIQSHSYDLLVPIPLPEKRLKERGFNQVEAILKSAKLPYQLVLSKKEVEKQSKRTRKERLSGKQVFLIRSPFNIRNKCILLVDDIYTTGATVHLAAKRLLEQGAKKVCSVTVFR